MRCRPNIETPQVLVGSTATDPLLTYDPTFDNVCCVREGDDSDLAMVRCQGVKFHDDSISTVVGLEASDKQLWTETFENFTVMNGTYTLKSPPRAVHYHMNENAGGTIADCSGNSRTGTLSNTSWVTGKTGSGLGFDGLQSSFTLANSLKTVFNAHAGDAAEHNTTSTPISSANATTITTLIALTTELLTDYTTHDDDVDNSPPTIHITSSALNALASTAAPTTPAECVTRLNDIKAKYNLHDADATSHTTGGTHQESTVNAVDPGYVSIGDYCQCEQTDSWTVKFFSRVPTASSTIRPVVGRVNVVAADRYIGWRIWFDTGGNLNFGLFADTAGAAYRKIWTSYYTNSTSYKLWTLCYDGVTSSLRLYVDSSNIGHTVTTNTLGTRSISHSGDILYVGKSSEYYFHGYMDELVVFDHNYYNIPTTQMANQTYQWTQVLNKESENNYLRYECMQGTGYTGMTRLNTTDWGAITSITVSAIAPTNTEIRFLFSKDLGSTWQRYIAGWSTIALVNLVPDGNSSSSVTAITAGQWATWFASGTLDIVCFLKTSECQVTPTINSITIVHDGITEEATFTPKVYLGNTTRPHLESKTTTDLDLSGCVLTADTSHAECYISTALTTTLDVNDTFEKVVCRTTAGDLANFTHNGIGRLTYKGSNPKTFKVTATVSATSDTDARLLSAMIYKSGVAVTSTQIDNYIVTGANAVTLQVQGLIELVADDYIEIYAAVNTATVLLTVTKMSLTIY